MPFFLYPPIKKITLIKLLSTTFSKSNIFRNFAKTSKQLALGKILNYCTQWGIVLKNILI